MPIAETPVPEPTGDSLPAWYLYWILFEVRAIRELLEEDFGFSVLRDSSNDAFLDNDGNDLLDGA